jgi:hypothetical protein
MPETRPAPLISHPASVIRCACARATGMPFRPAMLPEHAMPAHCDVDPLYFPDEAAAGAFAAAWLADEAPGCYFEAAPAGRPCIQRKFNRRR